MIPDLPTDCDGNDVSHDVDGRNLPPPPALITGKEVDLLFDSILPGNALYGFVPYYHFLIRSPEQVITGHINFKVGMTDHVLYCAGHIGYEISEPFRGRSFALHACRALAPFVATIYNSVILTAAPQNRASIRTIEKLGAVFLDLHAVPESDPNFAKGIREKLRYEWMP